MFNFQKRISILNILNKEKTFLNGDAGFINCGICSRNYQSFSANDVSDISFRRSRFKTVDNNTLSRENDVTEDYLKLIHCDHLPEWLHDNDYLKWGHRPELNSYSACFSSIFSVHTETGNIWTHIVGFIGFIFLAAFFLYRPFIEIPMKDFIFFIPFFVGSIISFGFSWTYHVMLCHSEKVGKLFKRLDYCGITLVIVGSANLWLHYFLYCKIFQQIIYISMVSILGGICFCISFLEVFAVPRYKSLRAIVFVLLGVSGTIACFHNAIDEGFFNMISNTSVRWLLCMGLLNISGACVYIFHVPERFYPELFNIWFQSHQIFHILVVTADVVHLIGIMDIAHLRSFDRECTTYVTV